MEQTKQKYNSMDSLLAYIENDATHEDLQDILKAVNNHAQLVEALELILKSGLKYNNPLILDKAHQAIKSAKGGA
jgi:hypothetical protein